jgi:hypothetical protein
MRNEIKNFHETSRNGARGGRITRINLNYSPKILIHFESAARERLIEIKNSSTPIIIEKINQKMRENL